MNYLTDSSATACGWKFPDYTSFLTIPAGLTLETLKGPTAAHSVDPELMCLK